MSDKLAAELAFVLAENGARRKIARIKRQKRSYDILVSHVDLELLIEGLERDYPGMLGRAEAREKAKREAREP